MLLIHSPLVGPITLEALANEFRSRGFDVDVPDLRSGLAETRPHWRSILNLAIASVGDAKPKVIVGHSGAGVMLPQLAQHLQPEVVAYVDAVVPGDGAQHKASEEFVAFIDALPREGPLLPPWHAWWGNETMARLIPDEGLRRHIAADTPSVPRSFYDEAVPLPIDWSARRGCCYLQLSPAYDDDIARARTYGWPTTQLDGRHLDVAAKPADVAAALIELIERTRPRSDSA